MQMRVSGVIYLGWPVLPLQSFPSAARFLLHPWGEAPQRYRSPWISVWELFPPVDVQWGSAHCLVRSWRTLGGNITVVKARCNPPIPTSPNMIEGTEWKGELLYEVSPQNLPPLRSEVLGNLGGWCVCWGGLCVICQYSFWSCSFPRVH